MIRFSIGGSPDLYDYYSKKSYWEIKNDGIMVFNGSACFAPHCSILVSGSKMELGENFKCNNGCRFSTLAGIKFGNECLLGGNIVIRDSDGHTVFDLDFDGNQIHQHEDKKTIKIGNHVWIANDCCILKGVELPDDTIVAYGSICTKSFSNNNQIIAGIPAKVIKNNISWKR